ncbi:IclR family transcriptional regulator [uncultured Martelella sp.]|uniref:IclR family transcriptional regulator n=1 Tax=uncultured Martelella sp. TaxID=392331 RepID=UPI0029C8308A|nr:IclR family transcriptional regulator [uncultured Martelella sp.]
MTPTEDKNPIDGPKSAPAGTQTLSRGLAILECVADGISDVKGISAAIGKPRSTVHRILGNLVAEGYLHHVPYSGYLIGPKLIRLGMAGLEQRPLVALAKPHLEALARKTSDTVHLAELDGATLFYLAKIPGRRGLEMRSRIGKRMPAASTGVGKGLMLGLPKSTWKGLYEQACAFSAQSEERPQLAPWSEFEQGMDAYVAEGFSLDFEENELGIRCVGAPVFDVRGEAVAGISIASAVPYMPEERMRSLGPSVRATADAISAELGWKPKE